MQDFSLLSFASCLEVLFCGEILNRFFDFFHFVSSMVRVVTWRVYTSAGIQARREVGIE